MTIHEMTSHVRETTTIKLQTAAFTFFEEASQMESRTLFPAMPADTLGTSSLQILMKIL
jgi:hypothetical protein